MIGTKSESRLSIEPRLGEMQERVLSTLKALGTATCEELAVRLNRFPHTITPRLLELRELGKVKIAKEVRHSKTSGKRVNVYRAVSNNDLQLNLFED